MTIRIADIRTEDDGKSWLSIPEDGMDVLHDETRKVDLLSIVRHIMRDEPCDMIPVVRAFVVHPTNKYGHNAEVEVTYSTKGYRAIYGAHLGNKVTHVQCYMD